MELPELRVVEHEACGIVCVAGEVDLSCESEFRDALSQGAHQRSLIVDLSDCQFIDSSGLRALIASHRELIERGDTLIVVVPPKLAPIFEISGLRNALGTVGSVEEALVAVAATSLS